MPRSGSTLHYQLVKSALELSRIGTGVGWVGGRTYQQVADEARDGRVVAVKVHSYVQLPGVAAAESRGEARCVYIYRDIRDVVLSLMHIQDRGFRDVVDVGDIEAMLRDYVAWTSFRSTFTSQYEVVIRNLLHEVSRLNEGFGFGLSHDQVAKIAEDHSLDRQRERAEAAAEASGDDRGSYDPATLLHPEHIRSGAPGEWRSMPTVDVAFVEALARTWLPERGYGLSTTAWQRFAASLWFASRYVVRGRKHYRDGSLGEAVYRRIGRMMSAETTPDTRHSTSRWRRSC